jgi:2-dehydro-3-deoxyglucarate aldolase
MDRRLAVRELRDRLRAGGHTIGAWLQIPHASIAEIIGQAGYDWSAVDLEHGAISLHQLPDLFRAIELGGTLPLARLAQGSPKDCKQALDAGAAGVIVPMVMSASQLRGIRDACRWPPAGSRGVGFARANLFGKHFEAYRHEAQTPLLVGMIEHVQALDGLEAILQTDGLDAVLIGPYDLSASLGVTGQLDHPDVTAALEQIRRKADQVGLPCGVHVLEPEPDKLRQRIQQGYRFLAYMTDAMILVRGAERPRL